MGSEITPTVGRVVHFYDENGRGPKAAIVTEVHDDRLVNLTVLPSGRDPIALTSVKLAQPDDELPESLPHCRWMPYQVKKQTGSESGEKAAGQQGI